MPSSLPPVHYWEIKEGNDVDLPLELRNVDDDGNDLGPLDVSAGTWDAGWRTAREEPTSEIDVPVLTTSPADPANGLVYVQFSGALTRQIYAVSPVGFVDVDYTEAGREKTYLTIRLKIVGEYNL